MKRCVRYLVDSSSGDVVIYWIMTDKHVVPDRQQYEHTHCDEMRLSVEFVTVGILGICRQYCCD